MDQLDHKGGSKAPEQRKLETDIAFIIKGIFCIVPPFGMKYFLQKPAGQVFQSGGQNHGAEEQRQNMSGIGGQKKNDQNNAYTIDWANGAIEKTTIYEPALVDGGKANLRAPAQKAVDKKQPAKIIKREIQVLPPLSLHLHDKKTVKKSHFC